MRPQWKTVCVAVLAVHAAVVVAAQSVLRQQLTADQEVAEALRLLESFREKDHEFPVLRYAERAAGGPVPTVPDADTRRADQDALHPDQRTALAHLEHASSVGSTVATELVAEILMFGNFSIAQDVPASFEYYRAAAGRPDASAATHFMLGFLYATGGFGAVPQDQARALLHYGTAHELGDLRATMALAYRYHRGISVEKNCPLAAFYYGTVAQEAQRIVAAAPVGALNLETFGVRLCDFAEGLFGPRASEQPSSLVRGFKESALERDAFLEVDVDPESYRPAELYLEAKALYTGDYFHGRDFAAAFEVARQCAAGGDGWIHDSSFNRLSVSRCYAMLGHMYLRGEGTAQNYTAAREWLTRSSKLNPKSVALADLAVIYDQGLGLDVPDTARATSIYQSVPLDSNGAYYYAQNLLKQGKKTTATELMQIAASSGNERALYYLATAYESKALTPNSCEDIVAPYKAFVESVEPLFPVIRWSFTKLFCDRDRAAAAIGYAIAAELGFEFAQSSAAYLLYPPLPVARRRYVGDTKRFEAAVTYYARSAKQYNIDSAVFLGDAYYYGMHVVEPSNGTSAAQDIHPDYKKSFHYYQDASNKHSKQGSFNVGYMYEHGLGVPRDYHLAKRYYDLALLGKPSDVYLPVQLALTRLKWKMFWSRLVGGGEIEDEGYADTQRTWKDWLEWYRSIKRTNKMYLFDSEETATPGVLDDEQELEEDIWENAIDVMFLVVTLGVFALVLFAQNRARRRREQAGNGAANGAGNGADNAAADAGAAGAAAPPGPPFQFNFMIIPL